MTYQEMTKQIKKMERILKRLGIQTLYVSKKTKHEEQEEALKALAGMWKKRPRTEADLRRVRSKLWR